MDRLSPALAELVALVRTRVESPAIAGPDAAAAALRAGGDADVLAEFVELAEAHRVVPLVARALHGLAASDAHAAAAQAALQAALDAPARRIAAEALASLPRLRAILDALRDAGIGAVAWKGPSLAMLAWGDVAARSFTDLDIVVRPADRGRAREVLRGLGWRSRHAMDAAAEEMIFASQRAYEFARDDDPLLVELHWAFGARRYSGYPTVAEVLERSVEMEGMGPGHRVPAPPDGLVLQAVHATKHGWSTLEDVAVFARLARDPEALRLARVVAREHGAGRALALGVTLAMRVFGMAEGRRDRDHAVDALADQVLARWAAGETVWRSTMRWDLAWTDGFARRVRLLARSTFDPTLQEWDAARLPPRLGALYRVIRPARLLARALRR